MLEQARRLGRERGLANLLLSRNVAESLPFADTSLDLVTSRAAGHHFGDLDRALDEVRRVLKVGGVLLMADSVAPEDDAVARWMNGIELRRDFSHVKNRQVSELEAMLAARGLAVAQREHTRVYLRFNDWVTRTATAPAEVERLRRDFLEAPAPAREAFQIQPLNGDIDFSWPRLVFRAVKG
jgi:SAM-dependent methyltransferase